MVYSDCFFAVMNTEIAHRAQKEFLELRLIMPSNDYNRRVKFVRFLTYSSPYRLTIRLIFNDVYCWGRG